jgi:myo-inositol 2-dehydrogenase / D-chiro-inositol 1-dehydrogenase
MVTVAHALAARAAGMPVVAVASRTRDRAVQRARDLQAAPATYEWLPGLDDDRADIVVVATAPAAHAEHTIRLLDAGAAVMVQTPMCTTLADADALVAAAARHGERLAYAEQLPHAPVIEHLIARLPALGPVTQLEVRALQARPQWGTRGSDDWGGGVLIDLAVHPIALAIWLANHAGAGSLVSVRTELGVAADGVDDWAVVHLGFMSGLVARIEASWRISGEPLWDAQVVSARAVARAEVMPAPRLEWNGDELALPRTSASPPEVEEYGYLPQLRAFADDLRRGAVPRMNAVFGRTVLDVVCAAASSAAEGGQAQPLPFGGRRDLTPRQIWQGDAPPAARDVRRP